MRMPEGVACLDFSRKKHQVENAGKKIYVSCLHVESRKWMPPLKKLFN